jgi:hypothetical protein
MVTGWRDDGEPLAIELLPRLSWPGYEPLFREIADMLCEVIRKQLGPGR